jgi:hypothetical protein
MMVKSIDRDYFARRALEEIERGERAASATVAAIHYDMALRYSNLAADAPDERPVRTFIHSAEGQLAT